MVHAGLFEGIGGFSLAARWMGWETAFWCEKDEVCQKVLKYHFPKAIGYGDITETDFTIWRGKIDILTGGFPCQPYSAAGKRLGKEDDRHLWPEMLRAIREIQPRWVLGENVYGLLNWSGGLVFEEVQADLEAEGYEVQAVILPACAKDAPHRRDRVWFVAHSNDARTRKSLQSERTREEVDERRGRLALAELRKNGSHELTTHSNERTAGPSRTGREIEGFGSEYIIEPESGGFTTEQHIGCRDVLRHAPTSHAHRKRLPRGEEQGSLGESGEEREEQLTGCVRTGWEEFPTQPPVCGRNDRVSSRLDGITVPRHRKESLKAYGNAVVPPLVYEIYRAIEKTDLELCTQQ
jgi:DNA (cytosine-5)-methyltransferase 1